MFHRVALEHWHQVVPYVCFALISGAFVIIVLRAIFMKKSEVERVSRLPLDQSADTHRNER